MQMYIVLAMVSLFRISKSNELCDSTKWSIIKGNWVQSGCTVESTDSGRGNVLWFGSADGNTFDPNYSFRNFILEVEIEPKSNTGNPGILIRAQTVSQNNDGGQQYYIGLVPGSNSVVFGQMNNGWQQLYSGPYGIYANRRYTLKVVGEGTVYNVWVNSTPVLQNIQVTDYLIGSIGLRTFVSPAKYHSVVIQEEDTNANTPMILTDGQCRDENGNAASNHHSLYVTNSGISSRYQCQSLLITKYASDPAYVWAEYSDNSQKCWVGKDPSNIISYRGNNVSPYKCWRINWGWSDWLTGNSNGSPQNYVFSDQLNWGFVKRLLVQEQSGYGIVNFGIEKIDGTESWTTNNFNGERKTVDVNQRIIGIEIEEQSGYGIIDMRMVRKDYTTTAWATNNPNGQYYHSREIINSENNGIVTKGGITKIQGREQSGYGIVDLRFFFVDWV